MNGFGKRLRILREINHYSIKTLADALGFRRETVNRWELGTARPKNIETILDIAKFFRVSPSYFIGSNELTESAENAILKRWVKSLQAQVDNLNRQLAQSSEKRIQP